MLTAQSIEKELKTRGMGEVVRVSQISEFLNVSLGTIRHKICAGKIKDAEQYRGVVSRAALSNWLASEPYFAAALNIKKSSAGAFLPGAEVYKISITVKAGKDTLFGK